MGEKKGGNPRTFGTASDRENHPARERKTVPADLLIIPFACYPPLSHDPVPAERYRTPDADLAENLDPMILSLLKKPQTPDPVSL